jgi:aryl-alcohol dehydrogenase-like predicted oxidoreductase
MEKEGNTMKKISWPGSTKQLSQIVLGTMIIGLNNYDESKALLDDALSLGINTIDTALVYSGGDSERAIGQWMQERGNREQIFLITKGAHHNRDRARVTPYDITADLMDSLARLRTDYIDLYLLHRDDLGKPVGPIIDVLNEHHKARRIRAFGGSNWTHSRIAEANAYAKANNLIPMTASSPNYGLCEQLDDPWGPGCITISGPQHAEARAFYQEQNMPVFAYSSLGRGMLSGRISRENYNELLDNAALKAYAHEVNFQRLDRVRSLAEQKGVSVPQIALAYILNQPFNVFPIVGAASKQELLEGIAAANITLTEKECNWLDLRVNNA